MIFDTHAHYDDEKFDEDREHVLSLLDSVGVKALCDIGSDVASSRRAVELAQSHSNMYAAVGIHPSEVRGLTLESLEEIRTLASEDKVRAIGEIGLDYYWDKDNKEEQKQWFRMQIELAKDVNLPVVIHSREASQDTFDLLKETKAERLGGVIHCYSGSAQMAVEYVKLGYYLGIGGVVTYKNARVLHEVVQKVGLSPLVLETDCPYLAPVPHRGKRNSSLYLTHVVEKLSELLSVSREEIEEVTWNNALSLYRLQSSQGKMQNS